MGSLLIPHPLVYTVRATTGVYSDSLDWVIDFTPNFTLRYMENNGPVKLYNMQSLSGCVHLPYLNTAPIIVKLRSLSCVWKQVFFCNAFV